MIRSVLLLCVLLSSTEFTFSWGLLAHRIVTVTDAESIDCARQLAAREGIFVGISSGATLAAALQVAREAEPGASILAMLPDTGERYLSTALFEGIPDGSDPEG